MEQVNEEHGNIDSLTTIVVLTRLGIPFRLGATDSPSLDAISALASRFPSAPLTLKAHGTPRTCYHHALSYQPSVRCTIVAMHLLALLALHPYFFSWIGVATMLIVFMSWTRHHDRLPSTLDPSQLQSGSLGGTRLCHSRNLLHEDSPARWVAVPPHPSRAFRPSPGPAYTVGQFLLVAYGRLMVQNKETHSLSAIEKFSKDLLRDPFYMRLEKRPMLHTDDCVIATSPILVLGFLDRWPWLGMVERDTARF